jgi:cytochrome c oxidase subunit 2
MSDLFLLVLAIGGLIFLLVLGLLLYMAVRFRAGPGAEEPRPVFGQRYLEIGWTLAPALVLVVVFALMLPAMRGGTAPSAAALAVVVGGHQWWWEFDYPEQQVRTANELHIPVGEAVRLQLESADVIHSFWIPRLNGKTDLIPGKRNDLWLYAEQPGTYLGQCAEFCGIQHTWMLLRVIAEPRAAFDVWVAHQQQPPPAPAGGALRGQQLFLQERCAACHAIAGTAAQGNVGPDLSHLAGRETLGAGVLANTPDNLRQWLRDPEAVKPGVLMPNPRLSDAEVDDLATYLEGLQ